MEGRTQIKTLELGLQEKQGVSEPELPSTAVPWSQVLVPPTPCQKLSLTFHTLSLPVYHLPCGVPQCVGVSHLPRPSVSTQQTISDQTDLKALPGTPRVSTVLAV